MDTPNLDDLDPNPPAPADYERVYAQMYGRIVEMLDQKGKNCGRCANWMPLPTAPHAGFCRIASTMRTTHSGQSERFGLMTTDLQVCSQWMDAHPK